MPPVTLGVARPPAARPIPADDPVVVTDNRTGDPRPGARGTKG